MARKSQGGASETLEEVQSGADKLAAWIGENLLLIGAGLGLLLLGTGAIAWFSRAGDSRELIASDAFEKARVEYLMAMGAGPESIDVPELANREAARGIRNDYQARFIEVAKAHAGTTPGVLARMEAAQLALESGEAERALELWKEALGEVGGRSGLRGMLLQRIAFAHEEQGNWAEAAAHHEQAAEIADYPLRSWASADAARCFGYAGENERALALYEKAEAGDTELALPDHQRLQLRELQAAAASR